MTSSGPDDSAGNDTFEEKSPQVLSKPEKVASAALAPFVALADGGRWLMDGSFRFAEKLDPIELAARLAKRLAPFVVQLWKQIQRPLVRIKMAFDRVRERLVAMLAPVFGWVRPTIDGLQAMIGAIVRPVVTVAKRGAQAARRLALPVVRLARQMWRQPAAVLARVRAELATLSERSRQWWKRIAGR